MHRSSWPLIAAATLAVTSLAAPAGADETTFCTAYITTLPYVINTQGHYCFDRNLSTAISTGNAITIRADFVVLDMNNFKLGGGAAGLGTNATGIFSAFHRNITIRNGNIRGFRLGIEVYGSASTSGGYVIENNVLDGITSVAIYVAGGTAVVRNNVISNIGGSPVGTAARGVLAPGDTFLSLRDNVITNVFASIYVSGACCAAGQLDHNLVQLGDSLLRYGLLGDFNGGTVCRDNTVLNATSLWAYGGCAEVGHNVGIFTP